MDSDDRDLGDSAVLHTSRDQSLWKWHRRLALRIPTLGGAMECAANAFANCDLVLQHVEVPAFPRLFAYDTWSLTDCAGLAGWGESDTWARSSSDGVWPSTAVLLCPAYLCNSCDRHPGLVGVSPADLAWHNHRGPRAAAFGLWTWSAIHLRDVDFGGGHSLPAVPMVYGTPEPAPGLDLAELPVSSRFAADRLTEYHAGRCLDITARRMFELRLQ